MPSRTPRLRAELTEPVSLGAGYGDGDYGDGEYGTSPDQATLDHYNTFVVFAGELDASTLVLPTIASEATLFAPAVGSEPNTAYFYYVGETDQSFEVPADVTTLDVLVWGAGYQGGAVFAQVPVTPLETLAIRVGYGPVNARTGGWPGGGDGGTDPSGDSAYYGDGGCGYSAVLRSTTILLLAGGEGGGHGQGASSSYTTQQGAWHASGADGGTGSTSSTSDVLGTPNGRTGGSATAYGDGGTQTAGGAGGTGGTGGATSGSSLAGGDATNATANNKGGGGGGGAGYYGGGGGGYSVVVGVGGGYPGGGGSSYADAALTDAVFRRRRYHYGDGPAIGANFSEAGRWLEPILSDAPVPADQVDGSYTWYYRSGGEAADAAGNGLVALRWTL